MTATQPAPALSLDRISLRCDKKSGAERGFVVGGVSSGKSTLMDVLGDDWVRRYRSVGGRRLILDTKPRYRAELTAHGMSARRRYRGWGHGAAIPGSVVVDDPRDLDLAWHTAGKQGSSTVIMQCESMAELGRLVAGAGAFLRSSRASRPQLLQVDETLDFFHGNGAPRGGADTIAQSARAGRERGTGGLYGSQRTKGLPTVLLSEMERLYALRIDFKADAKRLQEMGAPEFVLPVEPHQFMYWYKRDYRNVWGPYRLELP